MDLIAQISKYIKTHHLIKKGDRLIVGVSGGADSVFLLNALFLLRYELGCDIQVAHVDHRLRKNSKHDSEFVRQLCQRLSVPFYAKTLIKRATGEKGSTEEWAREQRMEFFVALAKKKKADAVALGHTKDDLAETILMKLLRGAGVMGARGILPQRRLYGISFIRPLLEISRNDLEGFLKQNKISFRHDESNDSLVYSRNKIRLQLLPYLKKEYNPNITSALANFSEILGQDYAFLEEAGRKTLDKLILKKADGVLTLDLPKFKKLHPSLRRLIFRFAFESLQGNINQLSFTHLNEIESLTQTRPNGSIVDLPGDIFVSKSLGKLALSKKKSLIKSRVQL